MTESEIEYKKHISNCIPLLYPKLSNVQSTAARKKIIEKHMHEFYCNNPWSSRSASEDDVIKNMYIADWYSKYEESSIRGYVFSSRNPPLDSSHLRSSSTISIFTPLQNPENCCICMVRRSNARIHPCGHHQFCVMCLGNVIEVNNKCPVCRGNVGYIHSYSMFEQT
jgi:hypothetical protein